MLDAKRNRFRIKKREQSDKAYSIVDARPIVKITL